MKIVLSRCVLIVASFALTNPCFADDARPDVDDSIDAILTQLLPLTGVPAYSVAIVRDGQVLARSAVGETDVRNHFGATPEHRFRLASVSKAVGATMLALLVQDGELDPDAPIADYIDGLPEQYQDLTARQLLAHTSGLPHYQAMDDGIEKTHYANAIASLVSVDDRPLLTTPGDAYLYSTHGYTILGALYESITGLPLSESAPTFINTLTGRETPALENFRLRDSRRSNVFDVVADGAATLKPRDQSYSPFGTGFTATAVDLAYFGDAVLHSPLLSAATREWLFRPVRLADGGRTGSYLYELAFGWRVGADASGHTVYHHSGVTEGARSALILYPEFGLSIAFLSNASWTAQIERTAFALANIVLDKQSAAAQAGRQDFSGSFAGAAISGSLTCDNGGSWCQLSDGRGGLSEWLRRYAPGNVMRAAWPAQFVHGDGGTALKLLTTVGIVELRQVSADAAFTAEIGNGRILEIRLMEKQSAPGPR